MKGQKSAGQAYGFINCRQLKGEVAHYAGEIKNLFAESMPLLDRLELRVSQGLSSLRKSGIVEDKAMLLALVRIAGERGDIAISPEKRPVSADGAAFHDSGDLYTLRASMPDTPDRAVADELAAIINQMYNSPLYDEGEPFRGIIAFFEDGRYMLRR